MYSREVGDQTLSFGVSGKLIRNVLVMYDRETDSLWPQLLGEAIEGPLTGERLEFLPAIHTTWAEWSEQHPNTVALRKGYYGAQDQYDGYYQSSRTGVIAETYQDNRLYAKEFVVGVQLGGDTAAYPYSVLNTEPVVNDVIGNTPVVVVFDAGSGTGTVFDSRVNGETLTFIHVDSDTFVDDQTQSTWNMFTGDAIDGELVGTQLTSIKATRTFWFGWKDWFPDTKLYGVENVSS